MPKPLDIPTQEQRLSTHRREISKLKNRSCGPWHYVGASGEPAFQNSWVNSGGAFQPMRFRWLLGGGVEIQGSCSGGAAGTVAFNLPVGYRPDNEIRLAASDDLGNFVVFRVKANGDVVVGV